MKAHPAAIPIGKAEVIVDGEDVAIFGLGALLPMAEELSALLDREGYSAAVINPRFVKPLDRDLLENYAKRVSAIVTFEDHVLMGGFGSVVLEALSEMNLMFRWFAWAGLIDSSNMAKWTSFVRAMVLVSRRRWRSLLLI